MDLVEGTMFVFAVRAISMIVVETSRPVDTKSVVVLVTMGLIVAYGFCDFAGSISVVASTGCATASGIRSTVVAGTIARALLTVRL